MFSHESTDRFAVDPVEGTISGTISPQTIPSSTDDNFHPDESWPQFQLFNSAAAAAAAGLSMDASLLYPYSKEQAASTDTVIIEDVGGDLHPAQGFQQDGSVDQGIPLQNHIPSQTFQIVADPWSDISPPISTENVSPASGPSTHSHSLQSLSDLQNSFHSLEARWLESLESQMPTNLSLSFPAIPQDLGFNEEIPNAQDGFQYKSESSSVSGDLSGIQECSYSATSEEMPTAAGLAAAFPEPLSDEESAQYLKWEEAAPDEVSSDGSQTFPNTTAFVISETPSESLVSLPSRPKALTATAGARALGRPMPLAVQPGAAVRKRKPRNSTVSLDQCQPKPLQIVQEDGQGGSIASADFVSPPRGARRKGPLSMAGRANAGLRRKNKDTCVQCRLNKRKCDGNAPCDACRPTLHEQPCARACFSSIVEFGTCNYISQRAINHPTTDGYGRVRMEIPSAFDMGDLLTLLGERQGRFNIRASQAWGSLYVLDLGEAYKFLKGLTEYNSNSQSTFIDFIDRRLIESKDRSKNWLSCVKDCDPMGNAYALLSQWNNMPSRASYTFVSTQPGVPERLMDIDSEEDRREILLAAQLSRIICRMMEVEGFRKLERDFYNIKWKQITHETHVRFLGELGRILLSLRWRVSWWKRLGDGGHDPDPSQQHYVDRVELLCRILYVYYTCVLAKLPSWSTSEVPKGTWSNYADAENPVWDDFPSDPTDNGFQKWMNRGRELIEEAGVPGRLARCY
ncbi:hypothetical protein ASPZODRAFT_1744628 [Penicilliopsis zonata CBS 506.65]|uniref:Zn(2)-C6 fungal-type domain-containing protein n=1 Tax=Penicilliopsis zonata CBS 506.65 TaxID=1073090 RepID=A0A1L9SKC6_9EURO|nr:hypothetical protein ASPZODRAFT_1744628 [Penicilliopsis zonata CBS 506.65]OJJ47689.1 hypothetical protein ASPZODRAFT_1744628 [Penicilliopsis zonata CBS 506.65]